MSREILASELLVIGLRATTGKRTVDAQGR